MSLRELRAHSLTDAVLTLGRSSALRLSQEVNRIELLAVVDRLIAVGTAYEHFE